MPQCKSRQDTGTAAVAQKNVEPSFFCLCGLNFHRWWPRAEQISPAAAFLDPNPPPSPPTQPTTLVGVLTLILPFLNSGNIFRKQTSSVQRKTHLPVPTELRRKPAASSPLRRPARAVDHES